MNLNFDLSENPFEDLMPDSQELLSLTFKKLELNRTAGGTYVMQAAFTLTTQDKPKPAAIGRPLPRFPFNTKLTSNIIKPQPLDFAHSKTAAWLDDLLSIDPDDFIRWLDIHFWEQPKADVDSLQAIMVIEGGQGSGKTTLMQWIRDVAKELRYPVELVPEVDNLADAAFGRYAVLPVHAGLMVDGAREKAPTARQIAALGYPTVIGSSMALYADNLLKAYPKARACFISLTVDIVEPIDLQFVWAEIPAFVAWLRSKTNE